MQQLKQIINWVKYSSKEENNITHRIKFSRIVSDSIFQHEKGPWQGQWYQKIDNLPQNHIFLLTAEPFSKWIIFIEQRRKQANKEDEDDVDRHKNKICRIVCTHIRTHAEIDASLIINSFIPDSPNIQIHPEEAENVSVEFTI